MFNLIRYCYNEPHHNTTYWLRSADKCDQIIDNHLQCGYVTRYGRLYASCEVYYKFKFSPICKI